MQGIRTAISITDQMTPAFKHITNALNIVLDSFASLQAASGRAIDLNNINTARRDLLAANTIIEQTESNIRRSATAQENMNNKLKNGTSAANGLLSKISGVVAAYATLESVKGLITATDNYTNIASRLDLIKRDGETVADIQKMIGDSTKETFANYNDVADMVGKLGVLAGDAFTNTKDIVGFANQISKHIAISGASAGEAQGAMLQLTQAMSAGVLRGDELNSVMEGMPTVAKTIEAHFKKLGDMRPLKAIAEDGLISAAIVKEALYTAADETNERFNKMGVTFGNLWNLFGTYAEESMRPVYERLKTITNTQEFKTFAIQAGQAIATFAGVLVWTIDMLSSMTSFVTENLHWIAPLFFIASIAAGAYAVALAWTRRQAIMAGAATAFQGIQTAWYIAKTILATFVTYGFAAGMVALSVAMAANPIGFFVAAVVVLIGVIYLAVAAVNHFSGSSISATGIIAGTFMALGYHIYNVVAFLWNRFAAFAEFLFNVFQHPIYAIKALFVNLATDFLDMTIAMTKGWDGFATSFANAIISAVNLAIGAWNKFVDLMPDKVKSALGIGKTGKIEARTSITSDMQAMKGNLRNWLGDKPAGYWSAPRMGMKTVSEGWNKGYNWGSNLSNKFSMDKLMEQAKGAQNSVAPTGSKALNENAGLGSGGLGGSNPIKDLAGSSKQTAANTGAMANNLQGTEEEIKYLREIGEREAINRFTTAEIKIDMKNDNHISNGLDLDGVINGLTERVYTAMSIAAEGVHK